MSKPGRAVILNGAGSAGKSSIARALQRIAARPFLHMQMDSFLDMMPPDHFDHSDGLRFIPTGAGTEIVTGPVAQRVLDGMWAAIAAMAREGNDIIADTVLLAGQHSASRAALSGIDVHWIGVIAPLDVIEARERARGDRTEGLARWQFDRVHDCISYDLVVDSSVCSAEDCAKRIAGRFGL